jgi:hypothetical protein
VVQTKDARPLTPGEITGGTEVMVTIITYGHPNNFKLYDVNSIDLGCLARAETTPCYC